MMDINSTFDAASKSEETAAAVDQVHTAFLFAATELSRIHPEADIPDVVRISTYNTATTILWLAIHRLETIKSELGILCEGLYDQTRACCSS